MREKPRPRDGVRPATLRLLNPLYRFSAARDAYVPRLAGGQYGPVLVDKEAVGAAPTGRFKRRADVDASAGEAPAAQTREP